MCLPHPIEMKAKLVYIDGHERMFPKNGTSLDNTIKKYFDVKQGRCIL
jgi:hypothetical protein